MVTLRATEERDLDAIAAVEADARTSQWIGDTSRQWHRTALADPDQDRLVVLNEDQFAGFAVLVGLSNPHRSIELRRIMVDADQRAAVWAGRPSAQPWTEPSPTTRTA